MRRGADSSWAACAVRRTRRGLLGALILSQAARLGIATLAVLGLAVPAVFALAVLTASPAEATSFGDIQVEVDPTLPGESWRGYLEYRLVITNRSRDQAHLVEIRMPASQVAAPFIELRQIRRQVRVEPSGSATILMYQPSLQTLGDDAAVLVDGVAQTGRLLVQLRRNPGTATTLSAAPTVLVGHKAAQIELPTTLADAIVLAELGTQTWSRSWLALSRYTAVVLHEADYEALRGSCRDALWDWVRAGGSLMILGTRQLPPDAPLPTSLAGRRPESGGGTVQITIGLGRCLIDPADTAAGMSPDDQAALREDWKRSWTPSEQLLTYRPVPMILQAVDGLGIPVRSLFLLILVFSLVIGPLNLAVLRRLGRRLWLLWTIPAISAVTAIGLIVFALIVEGWTPIVRTEALTVLDQQSGRATTIGVLALYAPVLPSDGIHVPVTAELTSSAELKTSWGSGRYLDWTTNQHLVRGWLQPRTPTFFAWRDVSSRSERLAVYRAGGQIEVSNGLGVAISELWLADLDGRVYSGRSIAAGAAAHLEAEPWITSGSLARLEIVYTGGWASAGSRMPDLRTSILEPGTYLAMVDRSPFLTIDLRDARWQRCSGAVVGRFAEQALDAGVTGASQ